MAILITGAAGYIGSHMLVALLERGKTVVAVDNYTNSSPAAYTRVNRIVAKDFHIYEADIRDAAAMQKIASSFPLEACFHFAGLKSVSESMRNPLDYFDVNVAGLVTLLKVLVEAKISKFVFSSSATVYGENPVQPLSETSSLAPQTVYGLTKLQGEQILNEVSRTSALKVATLRYFNPVAAHPSGLLGEMPLGMPNNLMPFVSQVAAGLRSHLQIFGNDYQTRDGTCIRDYIHVQDLVQGHLSALEYLETSDESFTVNLGNGAGISVSELIKRFEDVNAVKVPHCFAGRRDGDLSQYWADPTLAHGLLGWHAKLDLDQMCKDAWNWQRSSDEL